MFFHQITFRGSIDVALHFNANLVPFCFPKSNQNPSKCRPQEAPDNASIFDSVLDPKNLPLGTQLGAILALSFASRRPKRPPRPPQEASQTELGASLVFKVATRRPRRPPSPSLGAFWARIWGVWARFWRFLIPIFFTLLKFVDFMF